MAAPCYPRRSSRVAPAPDEAAAQRVSPTAGGHADPEGGAVPLVPPEPDGARSPDGKAAVLSLLHTLGKAFRMLCMFRCEVNPQAPAQ